MAAQTIFEESLSELMSPKGFVRLGLSCLAGMLDADLVQQRSHQDLCTMVCSSLFRQVTARIRCECRSALNMQAMTYLFPFASTGLTSLDTCLLELDQHPALCQHAISQSLQTSLHSLKQPVGCTALVVQQLSQLTPPAVLHHVWPAFLDAIAIRHEPTSMVSAQLNPFKHIGMAVATPSHDWHA